MIRLTTKGIYVFTLIYLLVFSVIAILKENYEFVYYTLVLLILINVVGYIHSRMLFSGSILVGLSLIGLMHILGGNLFINGTRLYDMYIILDAIKYDNIVHFVAAFVGTFVAYAFLQPFLDPALKHRPLGLYILMFLLTVGMGAMNEIIELTAVLYFDVGHWVGDYQNNALDLVYNALGSILGCFYIASVKKIKVLQQEYRIAQRYK